MVRIISSKLITPELYYIEASGLSTDDKPTAMVATGSAFIEVDTSKANFYDESSETWIEAGGGSDNA